MPANKYALIRYRVIDECLTNRYRTFPTKEDLRRACEDALYGSQNERISISTIEKDIYAMRYDTSLGYEAPIEFHKGEKGYRYTDENYTIKKVPLGEEDLEALRFAAQTLYQFKDIPVFHAFEQMLGKLKEHVSLSENEFDTGFIDYMLFEESDQGGGERFLPELLRAIRERLEVEMEYSFFAMEKDSKSYNLQPLLLKQHRLRWYLIARDMAVDKVKTYGLDRLISLEVSEEQFLASSFDPKAYFRDTYGISHIERPTEHVVLQIDRPQSKYFLTSPMHHSLRLIRSEATFEELEMNVVINLDLVNELISWMPHVRVISPNELRKSLVNRCMEAIEKNKTAP
jgi:predicted DNA-binding transcriptional regulator YafY